MGEPVAAPPWPDGARTQAPELPVAAAAADQARAIIAGAQAEAARIVGDAVREVAAIAAQIDDLERLREELERSARALVDEYAAAQTQVAPPPPAAPAPHGERVGRGSESPASPVHPPLW